MPPLNRLYINRIYVEKLFGRYTYDLRLDPATTDKPRLLILYGDNGSGKTTLLKLIFHLLAPAPGRGHRTKLGLALFNKLSVELGEGTSVVAARPDGKHEGSYRMEVRQDGNLVSGVTWIVEQKKVRKSEEGEQQEQTLYKALSKLNLALYLLSDDRSITRSELEEEEEKELEELQAARSRSALRYFRFRSHLLAEDTPETDALLQSAIRRAANWITESVLKASSKGDADANAIYTDIIQRIVGIGQKESAAPSGKEKLIHDLRQQASRSLEFSQHGLVGPAEIQDLITAIEGAKPSDIWMIENITRPYVEGLKARLGALQQTYDIVKALAQAINTFYKGKKLRFSLRDGIQVETDQGEGLTPELLSSGERQLLLLFCNLLIAREKNSIFIVDEPEISLNVKWQRQLVESLLQFTGSSPTQFILATHSIELLAGHQAYVVPLKEPASHVEA